MTYYGQTLVTPPALLRRAPTTAKAPQAGLTRSALTARRPISRLATLVLVALIEVTVVIGVVDLTLGYGPTVQIDGTTPVPTVGLDL
jgi:hypothetical protein